MKTRLIGDLTAAEAAALHAAFLADLLDRLRDGGFRAAAGVGARAGGGDSGGAGAGRAAGGERSGRAALPGARPARRRRPARSRRWGATIPRCRWSWSHRAFERIEAGADVVLGPAEDGGYYLIALRAGAVAPRLFAGIAWSTDQVLPATLDRCAELGLAVELLPAAVGRRHPRRPAPPGRAHGRTTTSAARAPAPSSAPWASSSRRSKIQNPKSQRGARMRILTAEAMREVDRAAIEELGIPSLVLMENAAIGVVEAIAEAFGDAESACDLLRSGQQRRRRPGGRPPSRGARLGGADLPGGTAATRRGKRARSPARTQLAICRKVELPIFEIARARRTCARPWRRRRSATW